MKFKFIKKYNIFIWQNSSIKIEFSHPEIQALEDDFPIKNVKDILYYYYTVKIYKSTYIEEPIYMENENDNSKVEHERAKKWELVSEVHTHDFPCITQLQWILNYLIDECDPIKDGQKNEYKNGTVTRTYTVRTEGWGCDDFYEIKKTVLEKWNECTNTERYPLYSLFVGCGIEDECPQSYNGINICHLTEGDIFELQKCVNSFIQYSINIHNNNLKKINLAYRNSLEIRDGRLYQYEIFYNYNNEELIDAFTTKKLEAIYIVGDCVNIDIMSIDNNGNNYTENYNSKKIIGFTQDTILFEDKKDKIEVNLKDITYIYNEPNEKDLHAKVNYIVNDFINAMSETDKNFFKTHDVDNMNYQLPNHRYGSGI